MHYRVIVQTALLKLLFLGVLSGANWAMADQELATQAAQILQQHCLRCHNDQDVAGGLSLSNDPRRGIDQNPSALDTALLLQMVTPNEGAAEMPKDSPGLTASELRTLSDWIAGGATWPEGFTLAPVRAVSRDWWSLQPLPSPESLLDTVAQFQRQAFESGLTNSTNPLDWFVAAELANQGLTFSPTADRRTLIRRLYFDLIGLPPTPEQILQFEQDQSADAYEVLVDQLLSSPRCGERWARHWLDLVHFADTHGYDKDKPRPHAWPYRDYVIRAFNEDKPWHRFIDEQIAGDELFPGSVDGIEALGFLAAGPWDFVGHAEVPESKIDGKIARHLDRDDMVRTVIQSFMSVTVGCAQCHDHKFDPIDQQEYFQLQAVFAAIDRADKPYFADPEMTIQHAQWTNAKLLLNQQQQALEAQLVKLGGKQIIDLNESIEQARKGSADWNLRPEFGYHSNLASSPDQRKWVQLDLGSADKKIQRIILRPAFDPFNSIGADFGLPILLEIHTSNADEFAVSKEKVGQFQVNADRQRHRGQPIVVEIPSTPVRFVRISALKLAQRLPDDYCFALAEVELIDEHGQNIAGTAKVTALDSIEAPPRWSTSNLVDGHYPQHQATSDQLQRLIQERTALQKQILGSDQWDEWVRIETELAQIDQQLLSLPKPNYVYAGTVHTGTGAFQGTGNQFGKPRPIHLLHRGDVTAPKQTVQPGGLAMGGSMSPELVLSEGHREGERRAALAKWISHRDNALTWRSVVNRVWQHHFGTGLVNSPNDFGRMGEQPSHPELLDWLAIQFRDRGQSLKQLHRWIVTSQTYRQDSDGPDDSNALARCLEVDGDNRLCWRSNRRKLDAEAIRDSILSLSGRLDLTMGGPGFQEFVIEKPEHSPHYRYDLHDYQNPITFRRTIYRFTVRSQLQPFLTSLDCADPSQQVATRNQSQSPLQALAMLNNGLVMTHSQYFSDRLHDQCAAHTSRGLDIAVRQGYEQVTGRPLREDQTAALVEFAAQHGLNSYCRLLFNLNEFLFVE